MYCSHSLISTMSTVMELEDTYQLFLESVSLPLDLIILILVSVCAINYYHWIICHTLIFLHNLFHTDNLLVSSPDSIQGLIIKRGANERLSISTINNNIVPALVSDNMQHWRLMYVFMCCYRWMRILEYSGLLKEENFLLQMYIYMQFTMKKSTTWQLHTLDWL